MKEQEQLCGASPELYRALFQNMTDGFALHEIICDDTGTPIDYRFLDLNPAFEKLTGLKREAVIGNTARELIPGIEDSWIEKYGRVALTGEPISFDNFSSPLGRWYHAYAYRPVENHFAVIFSDITDQKNSDEGLKDIAKFPLENPFPVLRIWNDGTIVFSNPASHKLHEKWGTKRGGPANEKWKKYVARASRTRKSEIIEESVGDVIFNFHLVPGSNTDYINVYGIDVTHLKKAEEELKKHRDSLEEQVRERTLELSTAMKELSAKQHFLEEAQRIGRIGNWEWDIETNSLKWSDEIYRIFGFKGREFDATYDIFLKYVHDDDRELVVDSVNKAIDENQPYDINHRITRPGGEERVVHEKGEVFRDATGKPLRMVGTVQDITDYAQAIEAIAAERRRLNDVLEVLPVYVALLTPDYQMPFVNKYFRERFIDPKNRPCFKALFNLDGPCENCQTYKVLKTGESHEWEWTAPDGGLFHVFDYPFYDSDGSTLILEMGIDITDRKRVERELKIRERQLEMLSRELIMVQEEERKRISMNLHDEFGQKLMALGMELEWMQKQRKVEPDRLETISSAIDTLGQDLQRIYKGLHPVALEKLGLRAALESLVWEFRDMAAFDIKCFLNSESCDLEDHWRILVYRVVQEALTNIFRHSRATNAEIHFDFSGKKRVLTIKDNGKGFDLATALSSGRYGLMGMRERAGAGGADFEIETTPDEGTTIRLTIPPLQEEIST